MSTIGRSRDHFTELEEAIRDMTYLAQVLMELGTIGNLEHHNIYSYAGHRLSDHAERAHAAFNGLHDEWVRARSARPELPTPSQERRKG